MNDREFDDLSAGDALHALTSDDQRTLDDALAADPGLRDRLDADAAAASRLAETVSEVVPPPALRAALLSRIASLPQDVGPRDTAPRRSEAPVSAAASPSTAGTAKSARSGWGPRAWFALAACLVLLLGIGGAVTVVSQQLNQPASVVALERIEGASDAQSAAATVAGGGEATLHWSESVGEAVLVSDGLPSLDEDKIFELWYVRDGAPISAGVFSTDDGDATAVLSGAMHAGDVIAVTVEDAGGAPAGLPTTEPIVAIATA
jgi:anti-sigma-K factor RskA